MPETRTRNGWHVLREERRFVLARHWPPRFDVVAQTRCPPLRMGRLAHQVRQDLWRCLRTLRGFSPVVEIAATEEGVILRAGGRVLGPVPDGTQARIAALLDSPDYRARWFVRARKAAA